VLYASSQRLGAFVETLAQFRPDPAIVAELDAIEILAGDEQTTRAGFVPRWWCSGRVITKGIATEVQGAFVEVASAESIAELRPHFASRAVHYGLPDLDAASIRVTAPRAFTQEISSFLGEQRDEDGTPFAGIYYLSKHGDDIENWAIFERQEMNGRSPVLSVEREVVDPDDEDLRRALEMLGLMLEE
jgi:hypothetical protein